MSQCPRSVERRCAGPQRADPELPRERRIDVVEPGDFAKLYGVKLGALLRAAGLE